MRRRDREFRNIRLNDEETFDNYIKKREEDKKYGVDFRGIVKLVPQKPLHHAWRFDTAPGEDWSPYRKTGIGWKLKPTIILAIIFFGIPLIAYPLLYLIYGYPDLVWVAFWNYFWLYLFFTILTIFLTKLIGYSLNKFDNLLRPYGEEKEKMMTLFINKLEFVKFSVRSFEKVYSAVWLYLGFVCFVAKLIYDIVLMNNIPLYLDMLLAPLPEWTIAFSLICNLGIDLIIFQTVTFFGALIYGLFHLGSLGRDPISLSITPYKKMLASIIEKVIDVFNYQKSPISNAKEQREFYKQESPQKIKFAGKTYFEFQRANRMIGEFLFNISISLIIFLILFEVAVGVINWLNFIQSSLALFYFNIFTILATILIFTAVLIFIFPQWYIHKILKEFKNELIDIYYTLTSRLEYLYYAMMLDEKSLNDKVELDSRSAILNDITRIEKNIENVKSLGTWSYDFPNKIKRTIFVVLSPLISLSILLLRFFSGIGVF